MKTIKLILIALLGFILQQVFLSIGLVASFVSTLKNKYPEGFNIKFDSDGFVINQDTFLLSDILSEITFFPFFISGIMAILTILLFYKKEFSFLNFKIVLSKITFIYFIIFIVLYTINFYIRPNIVEDTGYRCCSKTTY